MYNVYLQTFSNNRYIKRPFIAFLKNLKEWYNNTNYVQVNHLKSQNNNHVNICCVKLSIKIFSIHTQTKRMYILNFRTEVNPSMRTVINVCGPLLFLSTL